MEDLEIIPRRKTNLHLERISKRFEIDLHLVMRRIAHYHTISVDLRKEWHRLMVRTRFTDEHLKSLFMEITCNIFGIYPPFFGIYPLFFGI